MKSKHCLSQIKFDYAQDIGWIGYEYYEVVSVIESSYSFQNDSKPSLNSRIIKETIESWLATVSIN